MKTPESARSSEAMTEFQQLHSSQPGYRGNVVADAGNRRLFILTIWETEADAAAARSVLEPAR
jgi:heme-degrading monooxygenase HmoA